MSLVRINWKPGGKELRQFGAAMLVGFGVIGLIFAFALHRPQASVFCFAFGLAAGLLGLSGTKAALPVYWAWMGIAFVMGNIVSRVILTVFYYGMVTPMGVFMRLTGRDKLSLRRSASQSYWRDLKPPSQGTDYERQF